MNNGEESLLVILSSPSGVGKTTLTKKVQQKYNNFKISVSHTTRSPRSNEVDGVDYYFVSHEKFNKLIDSDSFYEYAKIYENLYGTSKESVNETLKTNDIIFDIDWQGTKQLSKFKNLKLIKIYLITNNKNELKKRLLNRDENTEVEIKKRLESFDNDINHWNDYDYILINKDLEVCFKQIENIINNHKIKNTFSFQ